MKTIECPFCETRLKGRMIERGRCGMCDARLPPSRIREALGGIDPVAVARWQKATLWAVLAGLIFNFFTCVGAGFIGATPRDAWLAFMPALAFLLIAAALIYFAVRLSRSMGTSIAVLVFEALFILIPWVNLLILLIEVRRATRILDQFGVKTGLMGAALDEVRRKSGDVSCDQCGYDLTGNVSGRCPECGKPVMPAQRTDAPPP